MPAELQIPLPLAAPTVTVPDPSDGGRTRESGAPAFWWGVDVSVSSISIAAVDGRGRLGGVMSTPRRELGALRGAPRLRRMRSVAGDAARAMADTFPPCSVWVEQASGQHVNPPMHYAVGCVVEALFEALEGRWEFPVFVDTVPSGKWKKIALGYGAAKKDDILPWAREQMGYVGGVQDEADAIGVAVWAQRSVSSESAAA